MKNLLANLEKKTSPVFLGIESSTTNCSVGIIRDANLVDLLEFNEGFSHAENLASYVRDVLSRNKLDVVDLSAVVIGKGPGSYTGLRIGTALAKGICFGRGIPLIALDTLKIMTAQMAEEFGREVEYLYIPMLDARRMEVYTSIYNQELKCLKSCWAEVLTENSFQGQLRGKVCAFGPGAAKYVYAFPHDNLTLVEHIYPSVKGMVSLVEEKYEKGLFEDIVYFEPFYLKNFIAGKPKSIFT